RRWTTTTCSRRPAAICSPPRSRRPGASGFDSAQPVGSMNLGRSSGGLPPDDVVEDADRILSECEAAVAAYHDASFDSMLQVALAPCSPFSVTGELMRDCAQLARALGVRLHTHLAETSDEEEFCR